MFAQTRAQIKTFANKMLMTEINSLAEKIVAQYTARNMTLCAAESCTGGLISSSIVAVPHASAIFKGSAVCYCDAAKVRVLSVSADTLSTRFAESPECAVEMARGALELYKCDVAVSSTGFLDANVAPKPAELAGVCYVARAVKNRGGAVDTTMLEINLDVCAARNDNRARVVIAALRLAADALLLG